MANLSINQVRHFYVVPAGAPITEGNAVANKVGSLGYKIGKDSLIFQYNSPGGLVCSDVIDLDKIMNATITSADKMKYVLKYAYVTPKEGTIVAGQEYIVKVLFRNYAGGGDDNYTVKYGMAVAESADTSALLKKLAISLAKNMKDLLPLATVHLVDTKSQEELVTSSSKESDFDDSTEESKYTKIMIEEVAQPHSVGTSSFHVIPFEVSVLPIVKDGVEINWAEEIELTTPASDANNTIKNGKMIADLEWFHVGARGDYYRGFGHPYGVRTKTLADPTAEYDTLDIHYAYVGPNEGVQKSEKDITIVASKGNPIFGLLKEDLEAVGVKVNEVKA